MCVKWLYYKNTGSWVVQSLGYQYYNCNCNSKEKKKKHSKKCRENIIKKTATKTLNIQVFKQYVDLDQLLLLIIKISETDICVINTNITIV